MGRILVLFMHSWEVKQTELLPAGCLLSLLSHFCLTTLPGGHPGPSFPSPSSHPCEVPRTFSRSGHGTSLTEVWVPTYVPERAVICIVRFSFVNREHTSHVIAEKRWWEILLKPRHF